MRCLKPNVDPVRLFDLLLAQDEVERRATVMEGAESLIDAFLAVGDIEAAQAALADPYPDGKQWRVIDALLEAGKADAARQQFERYSPFHLLRQNNLSSSRQRSEALSDWADQAVLLLDNDQLARVVADGAAAAAAEDERRPGLDRTDLTPVVRTHLAGAAVRAGDWALAEVAARWSIGAEEYPLLVVEAARAAFHVGETAKAQAFLEELTNHSGRSELHPSWILLAARLAVSLGLLETARTLVAEAPLEGLTALDAGQRSEQFTFVSRALVAGVAVRATLGLAIPELTLPDERLLKGVQHHLVSLGRAIGTARAGTLLSEAEVTRLTTSAILFLSAARTGAGDDWFTSHLMPLAAEAIGEAVFDLLARSGSNGAPAADLADEEIAAGRAIFRRWPGFRRLVALRCFTWTATSRRHSRAWKLASPT